MTGDLSLGRGRAAGKSSFRLSAAGEGVFQVQNDPVSSPIGAVPQSGRSAGFKALKTTIYRTEKPANSSCLPCAYGVARKPHFVLRKWPVFQSVVAAGQVGAAGVFT
jgi:hypothetical protein